MNSASTPTTGTSNSEPLPSDARRALAYLLAPEADQYVAIMDVLDASIGDLTPREIADELRRAGAPVAEDVLRARLDALHDWHAVSARTDASRVLRYTDLLARNWRYTATPIGRHIQRFYKKVLAGTPAVREIPLQSLARVVEAAEELARVASSGTPDPEQIGRLFVNHDDLDGALVGAEDSLAALADRFDLDDDATAELKTLLVGYATHVAVELERGSARAHRAMRSLRGRFEELAAMAIGASDARVLIERGALGASRGGRVEDWEALVAWLDPSSGRANRFALRLVRALPGMHVNLRRLHSSAGMATNRSRALALARACADPTHGSALLVAVLGDHPWRKLYGAADDEELPRICSWRDGPRVGVPELLRLTGRTGARGRAPASRDDSFARRIAAERRARKASELAAAIREVIHAPPDTPLSEPAARVALLTLSAAVRAPERSGRRTAVRGGVACTLFRGTATGRVRAPTWSVFVPGRLPVFHLPSDRPTPPSIPDAEIDARASVTSGALR